MAMVMVMLCGVVVIKKFLYLTVVDVSGMGGGFALLFSTTSVVVLATAAIIVFALI